MARILAVDDEAAILEVIKKGLERDGHVVTCQTSPTEVAEEQLNYYDLMLLDIMMPQVDGFRSVRRSVTGWTARSSFLRQRPWRKTLPMGLRSGQMII